MHVILCCASHKHIKSYKYFMPERKFVNFSKFTELRIYIYTKLSNICFGFLWKEKLFLMTGLSFSNYKLKKGENELIVLLKG